jgi:transposase
MWCVAKIDAEYVARMEDVLRLYARPRNDSEPVVCLDEKPVQLVDAERHGLPMRPGRPQRTDYEYVRKGVANIFCVVEPLTGRRLTQATATRTGNEFAKILAKVARRYPDAKVIHLVVDNLSTHSERCVRRMYGEEKGRALWRRFRVHFTPKHGSWLNAAELEASLVARECLGTRRIGDLSTLRREVHAWRRRADRRGRRINWRFRVRDARRVFKYDGIITPRSRY